MSFRTPTDKEKVAAWEHLAWHIDFARHISMDEKVVIEGLNRMSSWVASHSDANGERPEDEVQQNVNAAFWKKIAQDEFAGLVPDKRDEDAGLL